MPGNQEVGGSKATVLRERSRSGEGRPALLCIVCSNDKWDIGKFPVLLCPRCPKDISGRVANIKS